MTLMAEKCGVCGDDRESHAHRNHEFNEDGQLIPKKSPAQKRAQLVGGQQEHRGQMLARLMKTLTDKGLITSEEFHYIVFGDAHENAGDAATDRQPAAGDRSNRG